MSAPSGLFAAGCLAAILPLTGWAATRSLPDIPLGFEKQPDGYVAAGQGAAFAIGHSGVAMRTRAGAVRMLLRRSNPRAELSASGDAGVKNAFIGNDPLRWRAGIQLARSVRAHEVYPGIDLVFHGDNRRFEYDFVVAPGANAGRIELSMAGAAATRLDTEGNLHAITTSGEMVQHKPSAYQTIGGVRREVASSFRLTGDGGIRFALSSYDHAFQLTIDPIFSYVSYLGGNNADVATSVAVDSTGNFYVAGSTYSTNLGSGRALSNQNVLLFKIPPTGAAIISVFGGTTGKDTANAITVDSSGNVYLAGATSSVDFPILGGGFTQSGNGLLGVMNAFVLALTPANTTLVFSTYIGGNASDQALAMTLGPKGILYVVGETSSTSFPVFATSTNGGTPFQLANHGGFDAFLLAVSTLGIAQFATYIGGSGDEHAYGVAVDANGYIDVVGSSSSVDFPRAGDTSTANHGGVDTFVIQLLPLAANGAWGRWSTLVGGANSDVAYGVALDASSNVYVAGITASTDFPSTAGVYQTTYQSGDTDGFVYMLRAIDGVGQWSTFVGTSTADGLNAIALDSGGNIYVTGTTDSTAWPVTPDAPQMANAGAQDAVVTKLNNTGASILFSTYLGGAEIDAGTAIAVDSSGNFYVGGVTQSSASDLPVSKGAYQTKFGGGASDAFFAVYGCPAVAPVISSAGVTNAASYRTDAISPGGIIAIFGTNLGCTAGSAAQVPLPTSLGGVSVTVNGNAIPLYYTSADQINAQLPFEAPVGTATLVVKAPGGSSSAASISVAPTGPGIIALGTQAAAYNADGRLNTTTNGAKPGAYVSVYLTGQGPVSPAVKTAAAAPSTPLSNATLPYSATIGGKDATVLFLGLAPGFVGLAQANITIPTGLSAGDYQLAITIGGLASAPATITIAQ